jgi:Glyoxalase-like domain
MRIDHVLAVVADAGAATAALRRVHGLGTVPGPELYGGWGSRILPLRGGQFVQLLYPSARREAGQNPWSRWLADRPAEHLELVGWAVEVPDVHAVAAARGLAAQPQAMVLGRGTSFTWSAVADPVTRIGALPYFVGYDQRARERAKLLAPLLAEAAHDVDPVAFGEFETGAAPADVRRWLGTTHGLPVSTTGGPEALHAITVQLADGTDATIPSLREPTTRSTR